MILIDSCTGFASRRWGWFRHWLEGGVKEWEEIPTKRAETRFQCESEMTTT